MECSNDYLLGISDDPNKTAPNSDGKRYAIPMFFEEDADLRDALNSLYIKKETQELFLWIIRALHKANGDDKKWKHVINMIKNFVENY